MRFFSTRRALTGCTAVGVASLMFACSAGATEPATEVASPSPTPHFQESIEFPEASQVALSDASVTPLPVTPVTVIGPSPEPATTIAATAIVDGVPTVRVEQDLVESSPTVIPFPTVEPLPVETPLVSIRPSPTPALPDATPVPVPTPTETTVPHPATPTPIPDPSRRASFVPLDDPVFVGASSAPSRVTGGSFVLGLEWNGEARAYPLDMMWWHHIVNDTIGGDPVLVSY